MMDLDISETKISMIFFKFETHYIPSQFYQRYTTMGRITSDWRRDDRDLKTQIWFIKDDVRLFMKTRGLDELFVEVPMEEIEKHEKLPGSNLMWNGRGGWNSHIGGGHRL